MSDSSDVPAEFLWVVVGNEEYPYSSGELREVSEQLNDAIGHHDLDMIVTTHDVRPANVPEMDEFADLIAEKVVEKMGEDPIIG